MRAVVRNGKRASLLLLGCFMLALGIIGAFLPIMPTTIFLILAAWCFGRSSRRLETWLLDHPRFGPTLRDWRESSAVPVRAKLMALVEMTIGYALFWFASQPAPLAAGSVAVFMSASAIYVVSRPEPNQCHSATRAAE